MEKATIARSYATALFELAERTRDVESVSRAFASVNALLSANRRIGEFLGSPRIDVADKKRVLRSGFEGRVPAIFLNFLLVVLDKRRQRLLREIAHEYRAIRDDAQGRVRAEVTLAREPDERLEEEIATALSSRLGRVVIPHFRVDPKILGGVRVRYQDRVIDGTLRRRLIALRRAMLSAEWTG